jgi:DNA processing protein
MNERQYLVALYSFLSFGPMRTKLLVSYFGSARKTWEASVSRLMEVGLGKKMAEGFIKYRNEFNLKGYFNKLKQYSVNFVTIDDANYPTNLIDLTNAPLVLYIKGQSKVFETNAVAIVGSRKMTSYGREVARKFAYELASVGVTVVSGLALGIDAVAHEATINAGGLGIAVLASGLDMVTPASNTQLAKKLIESGGMLVSEYPLGHQPQRYDFPNRNRIISGLAKGVIVIEGERRSGTLLTASHAAEQGRAVFAVPGQITSPNSGAPHFLIASGAKMATCVKDVLDELDLQLKADDKAVEKVMPLDKI